MDFKEGERLRWTDTKRKRGVVCVRKTRAIALELKLQPRGENGALSAPINLIRIPDMRAGG